MRCLISSLVGVMGSAAKLAHTRPLMDSILQYSWCRLQKARWCVGSRFTASLSYWYWQLTCLASKPAGPRKFAYEAGFRAKQVLRCPACSCTFPAYDGLVVLDYPVCFWDHVLGFLSLLPSPPRSCSQTYPHVNLSCSAQSFSVNVTVFILIAGWVSRLWL